MSKSMKRTIFLAIYMSIGSNMLGMADKQPKKSVEELQSIINKQKRIIDLQQRLIAEFEYKEWYAGLTPMRKNMEDYAVSNSFSLFKSKLCSAIKELHEKI